MATVDQNYSKTERMQAARWYGKGDVRYTSGRSFYHGYSLKAVSLSYRIPACSPLKLEFPAESRKSPGPHLPIRQNFNGNLLSDIPACYYRKLLKDIRMLVLLVGRHAVLGAAA